MAVKPISRAERAACTPKSLNLGGFNANAKIPLGVTPDHVRQAMQEFLDFLGHINQALLKKRIPRLEAFLMSANFSSMVGEFMAAAIPKYCSTIVRNTYHNGHPDMLPAGKYAKNSVQHGTDGIEIKGSRYTRGWQGHNAEDCWLMVFVFDSNNSKDESAGNEPKPFSFVGVYGAQLKKDDWQFSGRSSTSRRTITASVKKSGFDKMTANWIYRADTDLAS